MGVIARILQTTKKTVNGVDISEVKAEINKANNVYAELFGPSGDDSPPLPNDRVGLVTRSETGAYFATGVIDPDNSAVAAPGERRLYARDSAGNVVATVWLKADGTLELNGSAHNAVRYLPLNTALQGLVTAINAALATKLDGSGSPGTISLDLSAAKVDEVKLP